MKRILIGHRGVGKSSLLERHGDYFEDTPVFDLDTVIAEKEKKPVGEIFSELGEAAFRDFEKKYFLEITSQKNYILSVGGGFDTELLPKDAEVVYVSRRTDSDGRLFLNRPRLNPLVSAIEEYQLRYQQREPNFRKSASWVYHLPEGLDGSDETELALLTKKFNVDKGYLTLQSENEIKVWPNLTKFELRTDVFSVSDIKRIVDRYQDKKFLVAVRSQIYPKEIKDLKIDWALELGPVPDCVNAQILSVHDGAITIFDGLLKGRHLKFSPIVTTWNELIVGYRWQQQDPQNRSFLPRTQEGEKSRWRWFRNLMWAKQKINFIQGLKDFDDQPSFYEYLQGQKGQSIFGAVLGNPIHHSRTPVTQGPNMEDYGQILAIPLTQDDFSEAMPFLTELGLKFAAVTSPLKLKAAELVKAESSEEGINSIFYTGTNWIGISSDADGFETMVEESGIDNMSTMNVAIWGGGGVISAIKHVLPNAVEYSARTGKPRHSGKASNFKPDIVIWAAPRSPDIQMPSIEWKPRYIIDLNYIENSMGLEYSQSQTQAEYMSGLDMFYAQAKKQFKFWAKHFVAEAHEQENQL